MVQTVGDVLKAGNTLHIQFSNQIGQLNECTAVIKSLIKGIKEDKFYLEFIEKDIAAMIQRGSELTISYQGEDKVKHKFGTYVIEQKLGTNTPLILAKPVAIDYTSFRRYVRIDVDLPFRYFIEDKKIFGRVTNLSGCGLFALVDPTSSLKVGMTLNFEFELPRSSYSTKLSGRIVRIEMVGNPIKQGIAIDFGDKIDKYDQVEIVVYVTKLQYDPGSVK